MGRSYYLGANSVNGFASLYEELGRDDPDAYTYYIKGGPGSGKSTLMKKVASAAERLGCQVDRVLCSGDPASLDGIYIREKHLIYVDATAPHVLEPVLPGISGEYLLLNSCPGGEEMRAHSSDFSFARKSYKGKYAAAYRALKELGALFPSPSLSESTIAEAQRAAASVARSIIGNTGDPVRPERCFLSGMTRLGRITVPDPFGRCHVLLRLETSAEADDCFLAAFSGEASEAGRSVILCMDPLYPHRAEAVLMPEDGIMIYHYEPEGAYPREGTLLPLPESWNTGKLSPQQQQRRKELLADIQILLGEAGAYHDALEQLYAPFLDTASLDRIADEHISALGSR